MRNAQSPLDTSNTGAAAGQWGRRSSAFVTNAALLVQVPLREKMGLNRLSLPSIGLVAASMVGLQWYDNLHFSFSTLFGGGALYSDGSSVLPK